MTGAPGRLRRGAADTVTAVLGRRQVSLADVRDNLWNDGVDHSSYTDAGEKYQAAVLEQYKLYVEMTDRLGARRAATNTFFLLANSGIVAALGTLTRDLSRRIDAGLILAIVVLLLECAVWYWILRSYQQLSSAKFRVIGALEERLPAAPWFRAEWMAVGAGRDRSRYWPITRIERWVPVLFAAAYAALLVVFLAVRG